MTDENACRLHGDDGETSLYRDIEGGRKHYATEEGHEFDESRKQYKSDRNDIYNFLQTAAMHGEIERVKSLILVGYDINARQSQGHTALSLAIYNALPKTVAVLLGLGAQFAITVSGKSLKQIATELHEDFRGVCDSCQHRHAANKWKIIHLLEVWEKVFVY